MKINCEVVFFHLVEISFLCKKRNEYESFNVQVFDSKDNLKCHDFRWYIENVAPYLKIVRLDVLKLMGQIQHYNSPSYCLTVESTKLNSRLMVAPCEQGNIHQEFFSLKR
jgi:hypothetical protein